MNSVEAVILGALQGATEFLPISSSGHLRLGEVFLDARPQSILFDIVLHVATLLAVVAVFRADIVDLARAVFGRDLARRRAGIRGLGLLLLAMGPTGLIGLGLKPLVDGLYNPSIIGGLLILNGGVLMFARPRPRAEGGSGSDGGKGVERWWNLPWALAAVIGVAQGIAVLPGISRSGATITCALLFGMRWRPAATFSFLLSIPAIFAALVLELGDVSVSEMDPAGIYVVGFVAAGLVGFFCLTWLLKLLKAARFHHFAWYCFVLGAVAIAAGLGLV